MSTLHLLAHSPFNDNRFRSCLPLLADGDALLLTGDAVHALQPGTAVLEALLELSAGIAIHALQEDLLARGLDDYPVRISAVDYPAFVELCTRYCRVNSWL